MFIMETKDQLVDAVKSWVGLDNELRELAKIAREKREKKKALSQQLMEVMKTNELEILDINDGQICYKKGKSKKPLNKENLLKILQKYFNDNSDTMNSRSGDITQFIFENRDTVDREVITRKIKK